MGLETESQPVPSNTENIELIDIVIADLDSEPRKH